MRNLKSKTWMGTGVFEDVCVIGTGTIAGSRAAFPCSGFVISKTFAAAGGWEGVENVCRNCPANAAAPEPAGCFGTIRIDPDDPEIEARLRTILRRLGIAAEVASNFLVAKPLWYGLWAKSPLSVEAAGLLGRIMVAFQTDPAADPSNERETSDVRLFVRATERAKAGVALHVSLLPPGHVDFGWRTIFPHCPVCKAEADLPRWSGKPPIEPYTCKVCGRMFIPSGTACSIREQFDLADLKQQMGATHYFRFARAYLMRNGTSGAAADAEVKLWRDHDVAAARRAELGKQRDRKRARYTAELLFRGLHPTYENGDAAAVREARFSAAEFAELLVRCQKQDVHVFVLNHWSADPAKVRRESVMRGTHPGDPIPLFNRWRAEGLNESFSAALGIPDWVVDGWNG